MKRSPPIAVKRWHSLRDIFLPASLLPCLPYLSLYPPTSPYISLPLPPYLSFPTPLPPHISPSSPLSLLASPCLALPCHPVSLHISLPPLCFPEYLHLLLSLPPLYLSTSSCLSLQLPYLSHTFPCISLTSLLPLSYLPHLPPSPFIFLHPPCLLPMPSSISFLPLPTSLLLACLSTSPASLPPRLSLSPCLPLSPCPPLSS